MNKLIATSVVLLMCLLLSANEYVRINQFAQELMKAGDYQGAIREYRRLISYFPTESNLQSKSIMIARCYELAGDYTQALESLSLAETIAPDDSQIFYQMALLQMKNGSYRESNEFISSRFSQYDVSLQDSLYLLSAVNYIHLQEYDLARSKIDAVSNEKLRPLTNSFREKLDFGLPLPYRNPDNAILLGVLFPGGGNIYAGQTGTGMAYFFLATLFGYAAYDGFSDGHIGSGLVASAFTAGIYLISIKQAVYGIENYNSNLIRDFNQGFE
ncbi:MAG: tetratricopeptide repeat protein [Candidatus Cloacimonetes bacterium]|nr:tetratricopeptide repeat protein [Candidatus Cloacimonadota bacterium]